MNNRSRGFTLIELLVVIAVIGILAAVVMASLNNARTKGAAAADISEIRQLRTAMELYYSDNNQYPQVSGVGDGSGTAISGLTTLLAPYFALPSSMSSYAPYYVRGSQTSYGLYVQVPTASSPCLAGVNVALGWWGISTVCNF